MFTRRTSAKAEGKGKTQGHYRQKPPALHLFRRHRAGFFPGPSWPHPEPPDHYRFLHISSGDTAPHYAFCARAHSLMESSVWHGREQEATNSLQDWSIKATIKVGSCLAERFFSEHFENEFVNVLVSVVKTKLAFFQMKVKSVFCQAPKAHKSRFCKCPEAFNTINV